MNHPQVNYKIMKTYTKIDNQLIETDTVEIKVTHDLDFLKKQEITLKAELKKVQDLILQAKTIGVVDEIPII